MKVTAPGKVLLLGGYAVNEFHMALSIALSDNNDLGVVATSSESQTHRVISKGFGIDREILVKRPMYCISKATRIERYSSCAYQVAASYLQMKGKEVRPLSIELENSRIFGDKDEKSGLGSSAASTVALISCLLEENGYSIEKSRDLINKLAQLANHIASERTGSGFDTATSTFGSIEYVRFDKSILDAPISENNFAEATVRIIEGLWPKMRIVPFSLEGYELILFNIKKRKTSTITSLKSIKRLIDYTPELYETLIRKQVEAESRVMGGIAKKDDKTIRDGMHAAREAQQRMSQWVERIGMLRFDPIEPKELTELIEKAEALNGVVAGRCPGAGGFDSVAFLVRDNGPDLIDSIRDLSGKLELEHIDAKISKGGVRKC